MVGHRKGVELRTDDGLQYIGADGAALCTRWCLEHTYAPVGRPTGNAVAKRCHGPAAPAGSRQTTTDEETR